MNKIERKILKTKINIILTVIWIILSGIYWDKFNISEYENYAKESLSSSTIAFDIESENGYILNVTDSPKDDQLDKMILRVYNNTYMKNYYQMALKLEKKCDYNKLNILINDNEYSLKSLLINEDKEYYYFVLGENELVDKSDIYEISLFISPKDVNYFVNQDYIIDFVDIGSMKA